MNLNPFELRNNDYYVKDMYYKNQNGWKDFEPSRPCKELFNEEYGSYKYLLKGIHKDVDWKSIVYTGSYQGELYCLGVLDNKYYYVKTGYGSCSGCDWYEGNVGTVEGLQEIQDELKRDIREFDSLEEFLEYFNREEVTGWRKDETKEFLIKAKEHYKL